MDELNSVYHDNPNKAPKVIFIMHGTFDSYFYHNSCVRITYPMTIIGAGQDKTFLSGYAFEIQGTKEDGKSVVLEEMTTSSGLFWSGLCANNGLSFLCNRVTFTKCGLSGVVAENTTGRLINQLCYHTVRLEWNSVWRECID